VGVSSQRRVAACAVVVGIRAFNICSNADDVADLATFCCPSEQPVLFDSRIKRNRKCNLVWRKAECAFVGGIGRGSHWGVPDDAKPNQRASWPSLHGRIGTTQIPCNLGL